eukprot:295837-Ditylum_brightwellii.AAC.1
MPDPWGEEDHNLVDPAALSSALKLALQSQLLLPLFVVEKVYNQSCSLIGRGCLSMGKRVIDNKDDEADNKDNKADDKDNEAGNENKDDADVGDQVAPAMVVSSTRCSSDFGVEELTNSCIVTSGE